jgi:hypothetical protein
MELRRCNFKSVEDLNVEIGKGEAQPNVAKETLIEHQEV